MGEVGEVPRIGAPTPMCPDANEGFLKFWTGPLTASSPPHPHLSTLNPDARYDKGDNSLLCNATLMR